MSLQLIPWDTKIVLQLGPWSTDLDQLTTGCWPVFSKIALNLVLHWGSQYPSWIPKGTTKAFLSTDRCKIIVIQRTYYVGNLLTFRSSLISIRNILQLSMIKLCAYPQFIHKYFILVVFYLNSQILVSNIDICDLYHYNNILVRNISKHFSSCNF